MSATAQVAVVLSDTDTFRPAAQPYRDGGAIGSVRINPTHDAVFVQSQSPAALLRFAAALIDAAAKAEAIIHKAAAA